MIFDLHNIKGQDEIDVEVCIVGAGAAGIAIAHRLAGAGIKFCLAEAGGWSCEAETQDLYRGYSVGHPIDPCEGRYRVFGGSTILWGGRCAELDAMDFEARDWVPHSGWPIRKSDLDPYYEQAKRLINFKKPWISDRLAIERRPQLKIVESDDNVDLFVWRVASPDLIKTVRSYMKLGFQRNFNFAESYSKMLHSNEKAHVYLHANLCSLESNIHGSSITAAIFKSLNGNLLKVRAKYFVLSASGVENARILLNLRPNCLRQVNKHDNIGRYFMQHPRGCILNLLADGKQARFLQRNLNNFIRPPRYEIRYEYGFSLSKASQIEHKLLNASAALQYKAGDDAAWTVGRRLRDNLKKGELFSLRNLGDIGALLLGAGSVLNNSIRKYITGFELSIPKPVIEVIVDLEQEPDRESRIFLTEDADVTGLRRVAIDWKVGPAERRTARFMSEKLAQKFKAAGLAESVAPDWLYTDAPLTKHDLAGNYHFLGATRMSETPESGVVDSNCRVFGSHNLYVVGASVFPTSGHANPTLTIVALALRLTDHLMTRRSESRGTSGTSIENSSQDAGLASSNI
ncbi:MULTISPECIES: GMC family oxidoreductase [unclassified Methylobacterium]|uniref:GMC family oxidoreductase n=1 Tax=unclassified Methylobacterium TaxID=2615210 RepID=UPI00226A2B43|nr:MULTISPECIES: GMC family oxidoreductase [unclassified Methylobacterium]